jgi:rare lipoprotein A
MRVRSAVLSIPIWRAWCAVAIVLFLAGCMGGAPKKRGSESVPAKPPPHIERIPDALPKVEPILPSGPNKPYAVSGQSYTPQRSDQPLVERGIASWYGKPFHGRRTANGEVYNMYAMTAAHRTMPLPSYAKVRNPKNGREIVVRVNDRGPFIGKRIIDLSYAAAIKLGITNGVAPVEVERITHAQIRSGSWRTKPAATGSSPDPVAPPISSDPPDTAASAAQDVVAPLPASAPPPSPAASAPDDPEAGAAAPGLWLQLGVFTQREGAHEFQRSLNATAPWLQPQLMVLREAALYRLQAGPYADREAAAGAAERIRQTLHLVPMLVQRD